MSDEEAFEMIGKRADELAGQPETQKKMLQIAKERGRESAEKYLYTLAIATLCGI